MISFADMFIIKIILYYDNNLYRTIVNTSILLLAKGLYYFIRIGIINKINNKFKIKRYVLLCLKRVAICGAVNLFSQSRTGSFT